MYDVDAMFDAYMPCISSSVSSKDVVSCRTSQIRSHSHNRNVNMVSHWYGMACDGISRAFVCSPCLTRPLHLLSLGDFIITFTIPHRYERKWQDVTVDKGVFCMKFVRSVEGREGRRWWMWITCLERGRNSTPSRGMHFHVMSHVACMCHAP